MTNTDPITIQRKRLLYQANHRGMRELDLILGPYAAAMLPTASAQTLALFEKLLENQEPDVYAWLMGQAPTPREFAAMVEDILGYTAQQVNQRQNA